MFVTAVRDLDLLEELFLTIVHAYDVGQFFRKLLEALWGTTKMCAGTEVEAMEEMCRTGLEGRMKAALAPWPQVGPCGGSYIFAICQEVRKTVMIFLKKQQPNAVLFTQNQVTQVLRLRSRIRLVFNHRITN